VQQGGGQHGGYRQPGSPAPVSGPGALSQRTDRGQPQRQVTGQPYGEAKAFLEQQTQAPMANDPGPNLNPQATPAPGGMPMQRTPPLPLSAPTQRPDEPVTAGAPVGAGPNVLPGPDANAAGYQSALGLVQQAAATSPEASALLQRLQQRM
jgi:hypothetical protein